MALNIMVSFTFGGADLRAITTSDDTKGLDHWMHMFYTRQWADVLDAATSTRHILLNYGAVKQVVLT